MRVGGDLRSGLQVPTTRAGVERVLSILVVGARIGTVGLMVPALRSGIETSPRPGLYAACWIASVGASVAVSTTTFLRGRFLGTPLATTDMLLAAAVLAVAPLVVTPEQRLGTWVGFQAGAALAVVLATAAGLSRTALWLGVPAVLVAFCVSLAGVTEDSLLSTAVGNLLTLTMYAVIVRVIASFLRRIGTDADEARAEAAELARREEQRRAQVVMHNGAAVLRLLSEPDLSPAARAVLVDQAMVELREMRAYLGREVAEADADRGAGSGDLVPLGRLLTGARSRFADLDIDCVRAADASAAVPPATARALDRALDSLLLNVRAHADARLVVLHLEEDAAGWTLTVSDDGIGFDAERAALGVGLRDVVLGELRRHGLEVDIDARVGDGTTVTIAGRI